MRNRNVLAAAVIALALPATALAGDGLEPMDDGTPAPTATPPVAATPAATNSSAEMSATVDSASEPPATTTSTAKGPGKLEAGLFLGGFISNYFHQFYDSTKIREVTELDRLAPQFGLRFAVFPQKNFGIEAEGSVIAESTKMGGDGVTIYGLGLQAILQKPGVVTPYVGLGFSWKHTSSDALGSDDDVPILASLGARFWLTKSIAIRAEGRFLRGPSFPHDGGKTLNASYGEFSIGISFNAKPKALASLVSVTVVNEDPDKDGVLGATDKCPNEPGAANPDGCPDKDKDGDGIVDREDKCIDQAETVNKFQDEDGCPDAIPDTDGDGMDDLTDKCKDQAEDKDAFQDDDGCPDPDNDNDGVLDAKDKCPGTIGPIENLGCPDTDGDGDGVVDRMDNCPEEKGDAKNQGCKAKQLVVITKDQLKILDQVKFVTGSAKLSPASNKLLDNIAKVLLGHLEIWKVKVEGHTDNKGKPDANLKLSQDRAQSVVNYLVKKGVAPERLEAVGHGDTMPVDDNKTPKGQANNRRVEFNIVNE